MKRSRLEAFSDGVIAIVITIMVLELDVPHDGNIAALRPLVPRLLTYALTFAFLGIYWSNHHHLLHTVERVNGRILWANLHLLFWLSLTPFVTAWMGTNSFAEGSTAAYGIVLLAAALAYYVLQLTILRGHGPDHVLKAALGRDVKGKISPALYVLAIAMSFVNRWVALGVYVAVALIWLVPDRRIEAIYESAARE
ncbi:MAG TPA: TMEM175 family protein [Actinomycetota bacterium]